MPPPPAKFKQSFTALRPLLPLMGPHSASPAKSKRSVTALRPLLQGVCSQIMGVPPSFLASPPEGKQRPYPPTMFVHMARDEYTSRAVQADMEQLHKLVSSCFPGSLLWLRRPSRRMSRARGCCNYLTLPRYSPAGPAPGESHSSTCCRAATLREWEAAIESS